MPIAMRFEAFTAGQADTETTLKSDAAEERARLEGLWRTLRRGGMAPSAKAGRSVYGQAL